MTMQTLQRSAGQLADEINASGGSANGCAGHVVALTHDGLYAIVSPTIMDYPKDWVTIGAEPDYLAARAWCYAHPVGAWSR